MTIYKSDKNLFKQGNATGAYTGSYSLYGGASRTSGSGSLANILDAIKEVKAEITAQGLSDLFPARGTSTFSSSKGRSGLEKKYNHANELITLAGRIHEEVLQNIDGKITQAMNDAVKALDEVNEGNNVYKSSGITTVTTTTIGYSGAKTTRTTKKSYTLDEILNAANTPIHAAKISYDMRLVQAKEIIENGEIKDKEAIEELKHMNNDELVDAFFPTEVGEFEELTSTWHDDNKGWLKWVDVGLGVLAGVALAASAIATGGASLALAAPALAYLGGKAVVGCATGTDMITGEVLDTSDKIWLGVDFAASALTLGAGSLITKLGSSLREGSIVSKVLPQLKKAEDIKDKVDLAITTIKNPLLGATLFGAEKGSVAITSKIISKVNVKEVLAKIDDTSLGKGWKTTFAAADYDSLGARQRNRLSRLNEELKADFSEEELAVINKYYDFQLPHGVGDDAFEGIGIKRWDADATIRREDKLIMEDFKESIKTYNNSKIKEETYLSEKQVNVAKEAVGNVTTPLIEDGPSESFWNKVKGKMEPELWKKITKEVEYPILQ